MNDIGVKINKTALHHFSRGMYALRELRFTLKPLALRRPIFVVGCSRSGTTMVYKVLSESSELGSLQRETHDFWSELHPPAARNWDSHEIPAQAANLSDRKMVCRYFYTRTGKSRIVDKNNQNGLSIPYLYKLFPDAHFVFIARNPGDNIESLIRGWGKADEFGLWSKSLPEDIAISQGRYQRWCFFLAEGWRDYCQSTVEEVCAFQYAAINRAILEARDMIPDRQWHELRYENVIDNPVECFRAVFSGCGLAFNEAMEAHCSQLLDTPYNTFSEIGAYKWTRGDYKGGIEKSLKAIESVTDTLGYRSL